MLILEIYYFIVYHLLCVYEYFHSYFYKDTRKRKLEILNKYIDKVIYINLEERKDRRESIEILLSNIFDKDKIIRCNAIKSHCGIIGCTKSHIKCLEYAINNECNNILIVEDDIDISKYKSEYIFEKVVKNDYDVINLSGTNFSFNPFTYKLYRCKSTGSYLVNNPYFKKLKNNFEESLEKILVNKNKRFYIDNYWKKLQAIDNWKLINPPLIVQKESYSDIDKKIVNHQYSIYVHCFKNKLLIYLFTYLSVKFIFYYDLNFELFLLLVSIIDMYYLYYHIEKIFIYFFLYLAIKSIFYYNLNFELCILFTLLIDLYTSE